MKLASAIDKALGKHDHVHRVIHLIPISHLRLFINPQDKHVPSVPPKLAILSSTIPDWDIILIFHAEHTSTANAVPRLLVCINTIHQSSLADTYFALTAHSFRPINSMASGMKNVSTMILLLFLCSPEWLSTNMPAVNALLACLMLLYSDQARSFNAKPELTLGGEGACVALQSVKIHTLTSPYPFESFLGSTFTPELNTNGSKTSPAPNSLSNAIDGDLSSTSDLRPSFSIAHMPSYKISLPTSTPSDITGPFPYLLSSSTKNTISLSSPPMSVILAATVSPTNIGLPSLASTIRPTKLDSTISSSTSQRPFSMAVTPTIIRSISVPTAAGATRGASGMLAVAFEFAGCFTGDSSIALDGPGFPIADPTMCALYCAAYMYFAVAEGALCKSAGRFGARTLTTRNQVTAEI